MKALLLSAGVYGVISMAGAAETLSHTNLLQFMAPDRSIREERSTND